MTMEAVLVSIRTNMIVGGARIDPRFGAPAQQLPRAPLLRLKHPRFGWTALDREHLRSKGKADGTIDYYLNTGTSLAPVFTAQTGGSNPFNGMNVGAMYSR